MNPIDVSVIIPTFHREAQLLEAVGSVLAQKGVKIELIVVDDSPEGSARSAVASVPDPRVQYVLRPEPSKGRPALVRNDGAKLARGRYLHFLDDDDILEADSLITMSRALDAAPKAGMAFGVIKPFGHDQIVLEHHQKYFAKATAAARRMRGPLQLSVNLIFRPAIFVNSACMARRTAFESAGGYDPEIPICEDADLWARIVRATGYVFVDRPVVRYRTGAPSLMHDLSESDEKLHASYRRIHEKYRQTHGSLHFLAMKVWARTGLR